MQPGAHAPTFGALPMLETERLVLRPLRAEDAADMFEYASDPEAAKFTRWSAVGHATLADTHAYLDTVLAAYAGHEAAPWGVVHKATGKLIGVCGFLQWRPQHEWAELAYVLSRSFWGAGYVPEAVHAALRFGFGSKQLNRVQATCYGTHAASIRVLEKVGMSLEGVLRQCVHIDDVYYDLKVYSMLRSEWEEQYVLHQRANVHQRPMVVGQVYAH